MNLYPLPHLTVLCVASLIAFGCNATKPNSQAAGANLAPLAAPPALQNTSAQTPGPSAQLSHQIAEHTLIPVELKSAIDSSITRPGLAGGIVSDNVIGTDGHVAIPAGSPITLVILLIGKKGPNSVVNLGLYAINIAGKQYSLMRGQEGMANLQFTDDAGKGPGHTSVHLQYGYRLDFKLDQALHLP